MTKSVGNMPNPPLASPSPRTEGQLSVREFAQFLNDLGKSLRKPPIGPALGEALVHLSGALRQHQDKELGEVLEILATGKTLPKKQRRQKDKPLDGVDLQALEGNQIRELLSNERLSKQDMIEVGVKSLGIPKSRLARQNKQSVLETVISALQNEEAYHVIAKEAEKEGLRRAQVERFVELG